MAAGNGPVELVSPLPVIDALGDAPGVLVGVDFDGTLAPIVDRPERAAPAPGTRDVLARLTACPTTRVAIISGRALVDVRHRVGLAGPVYAGNHGLEMTVDGERSVHPHVQTYRPTLRTVSQRLRSATDGRLGARVEDKGATLTVHFRRSPRDERAATVQIVEEVVRTAGLPLDLRDGKQAIEVRPRIDWDKGRALACIRTSVPSDWRTIYIGDDTTDEDVFALLTPPDLSIRVGTTVGTGATFALPDQSHVVALLEAVSRWAATIDHSRSR